jgi:hypothetical protein
MGRPITSNQIWEGREDAGDGTGHRGAQAIASQMSRRQGSGGPGDELGEQGSGQRGSGACEPFKMRA